MRYLFSIVGVLLILIAAAPVLRASPTGISITGYDITNAVPSGGGAWSNTYNGTITASGFTGNAGPDANYTGGTSGTLNDGIFSSSADVNNQLLDYGNKAIVILILASPSDVSEVILYGGPTGGNSIPPSLTGVTVTIGSQSWTSTTLSPTGTYNEYDLNLIGTGLDLTPTSTIELSGFTGTFPNLVSIDEVQVSGSAALTPEPGTAILWLTGIGLMILMRKRLAHLPQMDTNSSLSLPVPR